MSLADLTPDAATRSTDLDALLSRVSSAKLGYTRDTYSAHFLSPTQRRAFQSRPPLINLGTHARTWGVDEFLRQFLLETGDGVEERGNKRKRRQILSLGAGSDSRYWRFREEWSRREKEWDTDWVECDFEEATAVKTRVISGKKELKILLGDCTLDKGGTSLRSPFYQLLPLDLRTSDLPTLLSSILDPTLPTLLLAECVMVYLPPETNDSILKWFSTNFKKGKVVSYDPFGLGDNFGKVMVRNLAARNLSLPSADSTPTIDSLNDRLTKSGFTSAESLSIKSIRDSVIPPEEIARVNAIERIDEVEELNLVLEHYAITWGSVTGGLSEGFGLKMQ